MPPQLLFEVAGIDLDHVLYGPDVIRTLNLQRGDMEHLDAIVHVDAEHERIIGYKDVRPDEFWVPGHIPGRPILPGVIMIEAAAQLASVYVRKVDGWTGFIGFGGADEIRFRQAVEPGVRLHLLAAKQWDRHRRFCCKVQGVVNGAMVFEATIIGTQM